MRLTVYTDYSLRVLMFLALKERRARDHRGHRRGLRNLEEPPDEGGASTWAAGYVETVRGKGGGLRLARGRKHRARRGRPAHRTRHGTGPCFESAAGCRIASCCALYEVLDEAKSAFVDVLDRHTLADLVRPRAPLQKLLLLASGAKSRKRTVVLAASPA